MRQNAAKLNRMQIREQEALNRQRRLQDDAVARREGEAMRRTQAQYNHVASHGYGRGGSLAPASAAAGGVSSSSSSSAAGGGVRHRSSLNANVADGDDVHIKVYVRECDEDAGQAFTYKESGGAGGAARLTRGPTSAHALSSASPAGGGGGVVGRRQSGCGGGAVATRGAATPGDLVAPNRARVPRYLQQRKAEIAAEKEAVAAEAERQRQLSQIPPGHRRVSEEEKADTLRRVGERQQELEGQLAKIPIRFDTQSIQQRRRAIETELRELEAKRNKYSTKNPLYVPLD
jgi:hypothetical protein